MKLTDKVIGTAFIVLSIISLTFCNRPTVQRGPEQDSTENPLETKADNTLNADTIHRVDSTEQTQGDSTRRP